MMIHLMIAIVNQRKLFQLIFIRIFDNISRVKLLEKVKLVLSAIEIWKLFVICIILWDAFET